MRCDVHLLAGPCPQVRAVQLKVVAPPSWFYAVPLRRAVRAAGEAEEWPTAGFARHAGRRLTRSDLPTTATGRGYLIQPHPSVSCAERCFISRDVAGTALALVPARLRLPFSGVIASGPRLHAVSSGVHVYRGFSWIARWQSPCCSRRHRRRKGRAPRCACPVHPTAGSWVSYGRLVALRVEAPDTRARRIFWTEGVRGRAPH